MDGAEMGDWILKPDVDFAAQAVVTVGALVATPTDYGLVSGDVDELEGLRVAFASGMAAVYDAKAALTNAAAAKDAARGALEAQLRPLVQRAQLATVTTDDARRAAGIPVRDTVRTSSAPIAPAALVATLNGGTIADLVWNSNGNAPGVMYIIEKKATGDVDFSLVDVVPNTKYSVNPIAAGVRAEFRIKARRGAVISDASNVAVVY